MKFCDRLFHMVKISINLFFTAPLQRITAAGGGVDEERQEDDDQGQVPGEHYGEGDHVQGVQADGGGLRRVRAQLKEQGGSQHPHLQAHRRR